MSTPNQSEKPTSPDEPSEAKPRSQSIGALMWRRFCRNRLALWSLIVLCILYLVALFADFVAPMTAQERFGKYRFSPPTKIHFFDEGRPTLPFVRAWLPPKTDPETYKRAFIEDSSTKHPVRLFARGEPYHLLKIIPTDIHLFGTGNPEVPIFLLGADRFGRDMFSRIVIGSQVSLSVGLIGVALTIVIGASLGVISGYFGGIWDLTIQRVIEIINSIPTLPLWLALAAVVPATWSSLATYFMITVILSFIGWTGPARTVRGLTLRLQSSDLAMSARCIGAGDGRLLFKHMLPYSYSILIVGASLSIPGTILGETGLSFLGLGIRAPMVSWGVLLADAQNVTNLALYPWLLWPGAFLIVTVFAFNFLGDGVRDAADPFTY